MRGRSSFKIQKAEPNSSVIKLLWERRIEENERKKKTILK
jgi:hypothetical protein